MVKPKLQMILSPAKTLDFGASKTADAAGMHEPCGREKADELAGVLASKTSAELAKVMDVSKAIADENQKRFATWATAERRQAIVAYDGFAYAKLDGRSLSEAEMRRAHCKLVIPSGMWGPVRALDGIKPYRLEMACKKLGGPYAKLAEFWKETTTKNVLDGFADDGPKVLVNVASDEYAAAVDFDELSNRDVTVCKIDFHQGGRKAPTVHLKYSRGLVARYVIQNDVDDLEALKHFDLEGYSFSPDLSDDSTFVFSRAQPPPSKSSSSSRGGGGEKKTTNNSSKKRKR